MRITTERLLFACLGLVCWAPAYAYIDPGTGSALIQGLVAAVAAIGVTLKLYWHRIIGFLGLKKNDEDALPSDTESDD
jgi:hypothetical protein